MKMPTIPYNRGAVLASALGISTALATGARESNETPLDLSEQTEVSPHADESEGFFPDASLADARTAWRIQLPRASPEKWSDAERKRFYALAVKKSLETTMPEEEVEFNNLQQLRRQLEHPMTGEDVLAEYKRQQITSNLVKALTSYVQLYGGKNPAGGATKRKIK
jgi:hypothetical protein